MTKRILKYQQFLNENVDLSKDFAIRNLFAKYAKEYEAEFDDKNWIDYHYKSGNGGMKALRESLELIGKGEISDIDDKHLLYKELIKNDTLILVVHARLKKSPYGGAEGYWYEIGVYRNNPRTQQIGGGYGASGIITVNHTRLLFYSDPAEIYYNKSIVSKVCEDIKKYAIETF